MNASPSCYFQEDSEFKNYTAQWLYPGAKGGAGPPMNHCFSRRFARNIRNTLSSRRSWLIIWSASVADDERREDTGEPSAECVNVEAVEGNESEIGDKSKLFVPGLKTPLS